MAPGRLRLDHTCQFIVVGPIKEAKPYRTTTRQRVNVKGQPPCPAIAASHIRQIVAAAGAEQRVERGGQLRGVRLVLGIHAADAMAERQLPE